jgi:hypothetical protein
VVVRVGTPVPTRGVEGVAHAKLLSLDKAGVLLGRRGEHGGGGHGDASGEGAARYCPFGLARKVGDGFALAPEIFHHGFGRHEGAKVGGDAVVAAAVEDDGAGLFAEFVARVERGLVQADLACDVDVVAPMLGARFHDCCRLVCKRRARKVGHNFRR